jgi:hypothetical protein
LLGDVACTHDAIAEASAAGLTPLLVLGLESAHTSVNAGARVVSAGRFPLSTHALLPDERDFIDRAGGAPSWYATLGHDAAELAAAVLSHFPLDRADDAALVTSLHARAARELSRAKAALWSTDADGFAGANVIARTVRTATPLPENRGP